MKINLSKEHIKKCCELVDGYEYVDGLYDKETGLKNECYDSIIENALDPLYRDFLQLVIEGIEKDTSIRFRHVRATYNKFRIVIYRGDEKTHVVKNDNVTEAKEQAIAHVLDNL